MTQSVQSLIPNRKRCRNQYEEESSEFTPLSKRINNLHINNGIFALHRPIDEHTKQEHDEAMRLAHIAQFGMDLRVSPRARSLGLHDEPQYSPDLSPSENPFYYESNKLLFALYMERLHRTGVTTLY